SDVVPVAYPPATQRSRRGGSHTTGGAVSRLMPKPVIHANGSVRMHLPTPRGVLSMFALFVSGLVFVVSGLTLLVAMTAVGGDVPGTLAATAALSLALLVGIVTDRAWARARGVEVRFEPMHGAAPARYSILLA